MTEAYVYKMIQVPPNIQVKAKDRTTAAAQYLEGIANTMAGEGWEFYRVDSIGVAVPPGCLGALTGRKSITELFYVMTFRRPRL